MRFDKVLLFSKLTFSCHVKNKMLMQLEKDSEPIGSKYLTAVFFETGAMSTPTKSRNVTNCGSGGLFQS